MRRVLWMLAASMALTHAGFAQDLAESRKKAVANELQSSLTRCWVLPADATRVNGKMKPVVISLKLNRDGSLAAAPQIIEQGRDHSSRLLAESLRRAAMKCQPFKFLTKYAADYTNWQTVIFRFDPRDMQF